MIRDRWVPTGKARRACKVAEIYIYIYKVIVRNKYTPWLRKKVAHFYFFAITSATVEQFILIFRC